ncbi:hypothetical protein P9112_004214 [Eukaryota sp. TZLM1-RC]
MSTSDKKTSSSAIHPSCPYKFGFSHPIQSQLRTGQNLTSLQTSGDPLSLHDTQIRVKKSTPNLTHSEELSPNQNAYLSANTILTAAKCSQDNPPVKCQEIESLLASLAEENSNKTCQRNREVPTIRFVPVH